MATKTKVRYVCSDCGGVQMKWMGKCPDCGEWNTLEEVVVQPGAAGGGGGTVSLAGAPEPLSLPAIPAATPTNRRQFIPKDPICRPSRMTNGLLFSAPRGGPIALRKRDHGQVRRHRLA